MTASPRFFAGIKPLASRYPVPASEAFLRRSLGSKDLATGDVLTVIPRYLRRSVRVRGDVGGAGEDGGGADAACLLGGEEDVVAGHAPVSFGKITPRRLMLTASSKASTCKRAFLSILAVRLEFAVEVAVAQGVLGLHYLVDLGRALVDGWGARVAEVALRGRLLGRVPGGAVDLQRVVGCGEGGLGG